MFERHPEVAYWIEPRSVWVHGNAYRKDDELSAEDLTERIARYIDGRFVRFMERRGRRRFAEKTPSNCLRIRFILALYPDCKLINIIRDGRAVVRSVPQIQKRPPRKGLISKRLKETPVWDLPAYIPHFFRTTWQTKIRKKRSVYWGPRPAGWREWIGLPPHILAARQWKAMVGKTIEDTAGLPGERYREVRFERLMREPAGVLGELVEFAELSPCQEMIDFAQAQIEPDRSRKWVSTITVEQGREIAAELEPLLSQLGYTGAEQ